MSKKKSPPASREAGRHEVAEEQRLQKVLAAAGIGSRRNCEELIAEGRVEVDKQVVTQPGTKVDPDRQTIRVDGVTLTIPRRVYYAVNKPAGFVSTNSDPGGRLRVIDLIGTDQRVFTVGRLDKSSEGLIVVTNDGELANRLTHPRYGIEKTYIVHVSGHPTRESLEQLEQGVYLAEGLARVAGIKTRRRFKHYTELEIVLSEGRNREIRRLLARIGNKVMRLRRIAIGPLKLGNLPVGTHRRLTDREVSQLRRAVNARRSSGSGKRPAKKAATSRNAAGAGKSGAGSSGDRKSGGARTGKTVASRKRSARRPAKKRTTKRRGS